MTPEQLQFHYFNMHDLDSDESLDGIELIKAITHFDEGNTSITLLYFTYAVTSSEEWNGNTVKENLILEIKIEASVKTWEPCGLYLALVNYRTSRKSGFPTKFNSATTTSNNGTRNRADVRSDL